MAHKPKRGSKGKPAAMNYQALAVSRRIDSPAPENLAVDWKPRADGSGELAVAYEGPLAARDEVLARAGAWRAGGERWAEVQEVKLSRQGPNRWVGEIPVRAGAPVEALEIVFRAGNDWDNGGRAPLGYYEWNVRERQITAR